MTQLADWLAEAIVAKQQIKKQRQGLDANDHSMFTRALNRYSQTEEEIAEFRRRQPVGTNDVRVTESWSPNREPSKKISTPKPVDNRVQSSGQKSAIDSLFGKLKNL